MDRSAQNACCRCVLSTRALSSFARRLSSSHLSLSRPQPKKKKKLQAENLAALVKAAGVTGPPYLPGMYAKVFAKKPISELITNVGAGGGGGGGGGGSGGGGGGGGGAAAAEEKKEEKEEEEEEGDDDMGFSLFD